jgi:hypothetical protein
MEGSFIRFRLESYTPISNTGPEQKRRTRTGCLTCRTRRKKCDEMKPSCLACRRNYLSCKWPETNSVTGEAASTDDILGDRRRSWQLMKIAPVERLNPSHISRNMRSGYQKGDSYLLEHYLSVTSHQLTGREQKHNPFLAHLIPLALQDRKVLEGVLAVSGAHLSYQAERFEHDARLHYAVTLRSVKHTLQAWHTLDTYDLIALLTTTLLLCYFEVSTHLVRKGAGR